MKRSEMLEQIAKTLYTQAKRLDDGDVLALTDFHDSKDEWIADADEILSKIEDLGMLPHRAVMIDNPNIKTTKDMMIKPMHTVKDIVGWEQEEPERSGAW